MEIEKKDEIMAWLLKKNGLEPNLWLCLDEYHMNNGYTYELMAERKWGCSCKNASSITFWAEIDNHRRVKICKFKADNLGGILPMSLHEGLDLLIASFKELGPIYIVNGPIDFNDTSDHIFIDTEDYESLAIQCDLEKKG